MRCWSKDTTTHANRFKYKNHDAKAADVAIAAGDFLPKDEPRYNQGFAARKSHIFSSNPKGYFEFTIPFNHIFGFSDYNKVLYGVQQTLTLTRSTTDDLAIHRRDIDDLAGKVELSNITWYTVRYQLSIGAGAIMQERAAARIQLPILYIVRSSRKVNIPTVTTS